MDVNTILNVMERYQLTAEELLLVWLTINARDTEGHPELFQKWYNNGGKSRLKTLFESLKEKHVIVKDYAPDNYDPNDVEFNKVFLKGWFKYSLALGQELMDNYPTFGFISGKYFPLKDISKRFSSLDEFYWFYAKEIGHNLEKHKEILNLLQWGKSNNLITNNITGFVVSHLWDALKEMQEHPEIANNVANILRDE